MQDDSAPSARVPRCCRFDSGGKRRETPLARCGGRRPALAATCIVSGSGARTSRPQHAVDFAAGGTRLLVLRAISPPEARIPATDAVDGHPTRNGQRFTFSGRHQLVHRTMRGEPSSTPGSQAGRCRARIVELQGAAGLIREESAARWAESDVSFGRVASEAARALEERSGCTLTLCGRRRPSIPITRSRNARESRPCVPAAPEPRREPRRGEVRSRPERRRLPAQSA
jgi:hypothetical protein